MIVKSYEDEKEWLQDRLGRITGTKVKDLISKRKMSGRKIGFYQLIADKMAVPGITENAMERGRELEKEAVARFMQEAKIVVDPSLVMWVREDNQNIAYSPDATIKDINGDVTEAVEAKCLSSARHIEAYITQHVPKDYEDQVLQAFIVNEKLKKLYLVFYDDRLVSKQLFYITVERDQKKVDEYLETERKILEEVDRYVAELTEF